MYLVRDLIYTKNNPTTSVNYNQNYELEINLTL